MKNVRLFKDNKIEPMTVEMLAELYDSLDYDEKQKFYKYVHEFKWKKNRYIGIKLVYYEKGSQGEVIGEDFETGYLISLEGTYILPWGEILKDKNTDKIIQGFYEYAGPKLVEIIEGYLKESHENHPESVHIMNWQPLGYHPG